ncbi:MAG: YndJ family transporter [Bacteroidota bacterium]
MPALRFARSALAGMIVWSVLLFVPLAAGEGVFDLVARLVLLAVLVVVPLLLEAASDVWGRDALPMRLASRASLAAGLLAAASFLAPTGPRGGAIALGWAVFSVLVAWEGARRLWAMRQRRLWRTEEVSLALGMVALPGGAAWLVMARAGIDPGPYGDLIVLLTAIHFHYAAVVVPMWAGYLGRALRERWPGAHRAYSVLVAASIAGTPLVALGIALSKTPAGGTAAETLGVLLLCTGAVGLGGLAVIVASRLDQRWNQMMIGVSGASLILGMGLALWFHLGDPLGIGAPDVAWMVPRHGWVNGVGFALWGALGWRRLRPRPAASPEATSPEASPAPESEAASGALS